MEQQTALREPGKPFKVEAIEWKKTRMVRELRESHGYSAYELSFLLGRRDLYVRDAENPLHTLTYSVNEVNYLRQVFECGLERLMPGKVEPVEYTLLVNVGQNDEGQPIYSIQKLVGTDRWLRLSEMVEEAKDAVLPFPDAVPAGEVIAYINDLFGQGYFKQGKTALAVFKACQKKLGPGVRPRDLITALTDHTKKRKAPRLVKKTNEAGRAVFVKE